MLLLIKHNQVKIETWIWNVSIFFCYSTKTHQSYILAWKLNESFLFSTEIEFEIFSLNSIFSYWISLWNQMGGWKTFVFINKIKMNVTWHENDYAIIVVIWVHLYFWKRLSTNLIIFEKKFKMKIDKWVGGEMFFI